MNNTINPSNYEYEEEINLRELLAFILRRGRILLVLCILFAFALGAIKGIKGFQDLQDPEKVAESIAEAELNQQNYETAKAQLMSQMNEYNRQIEDYQTYQEKSLYMRIDPYAVYKESVTYALTTDYQILPGMNFQTPNWMGPVLSAYTTIATSITLKDLSDEGRQGLSEEWDADSLDRLLSVSSDPNNGRLTVTASAESKIRAKAILEAAKKKVELSKEDVCNAAGNHEITIISEKSVITVDQSIINFHEDQLKKITNLREAADKAAEKYQKLHEPKDESLSVKEIVKRVMIFAVAGLLAGLFLGFVLLTAEFLLNGRLNSLSGLRDRYHTRILTVIPRSNHQKLEGLLNEIEGCGTNIKDRKTALRIIAASLKKSGTGSRLAVFGTVSEEDKKEIAEILNDGAEDIQVTAGGNLVENPEAVILATESDAAILVEERNRSKEADIQKELELLHSMGILVEGFIII